MYLNYNVFLSYMKILNFIKYLNFKEKKLTLHTCLPYFSLYLFENFTLKRDKNNMDLDPIFRFEKEKTFISRSKINFSSACFAFFFYSIIF